MTWQWRSCWQLGRSRAVRSRLFIAYHQRHRRWNHLLVRAGSTIAGSVPGVLEGRGLGLSRGVNDRGYVAERNARPLSEPSKSGRGRESEPPESWQEPA